MADRDSEERPRPSPAAAAHFRAEVQDIERERQAAMLANRARLDKMRIPPASAHDVVQPRPLPWHERDDLF